MPLFKILHYFWW